MKYCILTDLDILTPSITKQVNDLVKVNPHLLNLTSEYNDSKADDRNHKYFKFASGQEELDQYWDYKRRMLAYFGERKNMNFNIYEMPKDLELEIFERLPTKIKNMERPPYVRLQTSTDGDYLIPHTDTDRSVVLISTVSNINETTWFWRMTEPHHIAIRTLPDIDKIEPVSCAKIGPGETWLYDVTSIHSVEREPNRRHETRITINIGWTKTTMDDVLRQLI